MPKLKNHKGVHSKVSLHTQNPQPHGTTLIPTVFAWAITLLQSPSKGSPLNLCSLFFILAIS